MNTAKEYQSSSAEAFFKQKPKGKETKHIRLNSLITPSIYNCLQQEAQRREVTINVIVNDALDHFKESVLKNGDK
jgi:hypothetical protein